MAWPGDYYLPAKSIIDDTPVSSGASAWQIRKEQLDGLRLMINERIALANACQASVGLTSFAALDEHEKRQSGSETVYLKKLQYACRTLCQFYIDTDLYSDGDLAGASITDCTQRKVCWGRGGLSVAYVLASISGGVGTGSSRNWTRIPARNPWDKSALGGMIASGDPCFKEHVNEIYQVLQKLTHCITTVVYGASAKFLTVRDSSGGTDYKLKSVSSTTQAGAETAYAAAGYGAAANLQMSSFFAPTWPFYSLSSNPGTYRMDLTGFSGGSTKLFWGCTGDGAMSPPTTCDGTMYVESEQDNGGTYTTSAYGSDSQPEWGSTELVSHGWVVYPVAVAAPTLTYT